MSDKVQMDSHEELEWQGTTGRVLQNVTALGLSVGGIGGQRTRRKSEWSCLVLGRLVSVYIGHGFKQGR
jgi:hypothetical protein